MIHALIFANGHMIAPPGLVELATSADLIIAADGGTHNCLEAGFQPSVIIGDLDSLTAGEVSDFRKGGVQIISYPAQKDETDLELAVSYALNQSVQEAVILGALGDRWDMTLANILLLAQPHFHSIALRLLDGSQELTLHYPGAAWQVSGERGDTVSLIPFQGDATGITTLGLEYPLNHETLHFGSPRGVSNVLLQQPAEVSFEQGLLICIVQHFSPDPGEK